MPDRRTPTADQRSAALVKAAAESAVALALAGGADATADAVARALRDQRVDSDLAAHQRHLDVINGSQERTSRALAGLRENMGKLAEASERQTAISEARAQDDATQAAARFSRRQIIVAWAGGTAAWAAVLATVLATAH